MIGGRFRDPITGEAILVERSGTTLRMTAPKGGISPEMREWSRANKDALLQLIPEGQGLNLVSDDKRPAIHAESYAEYKAKMLNHMFNTLGTSKYPSRITVVTVQHGERRRGKRAKGDGLEG
jgi:hypothetical protein